MQPSRSRSTEASRLPRATAKPSSTAKALGCKRLQAAATSCRLWQGTLQNSSGKLFAPSRVGTWKEHLRHPKTHLPRQKTLIIHGLLRKGIFMFFHVFFCPLWSSCATGSCSSSGFTRLGSSRTRSAKGMQKLLLGKSWKHKLPKSANHLPQNPETAAQHLKVWEAMLGKQVAGSPWLNTRHLQKGGKTDTIFRHMLRRESNPGLLSEGRGAACQKCWKLALCPPLESAKPVVPAVRCCH